MSSERRRLFVIRLSAFAGLAGAVAFTLAVIGSFVGIAAPWLWVIVAIGVVGAGVLVFRGPAARVIESESQGGPPSE